MNRCLPVLLLLVAGVLAACQGGPEPPPCTGDVRPTCAGGAPAVFSDAIAAQEAFTRRGGSVTAVLEDASWLRFGGDPATVEANHRAYFEYGYTTFLVELRSEAFSQPTNETFTLEDSNGKHVSSRPLSYEGSQVLVDDRFFSAFSLSFQHVISSDVRWIRLTRVLDGSTVEWTFPGGGSSPSAP